MNENEQQKKPDLSEGKALDKENELADLNNLMLLAADGNKEAFARLLKERWARLGYKE
jgi:hypothetical protein